MTVVVTVTRITPPAGAGRVIASKKVAEAAMSVSIAEPHLMARRVESETGARRASTPTLLRKCTIFALRLRKSAVNILKNRSDNFFHTSGHISGLRRPAFALTVLVKSPARP
ncbi:MAG: hypothetical protein ACFE0P_12390 [Oceanicaulis sp.]